MAGSINYFAPFPAELLQYMLDYVGNPTISSVSKLFKEQSDDISKRELKQIWKYLHPGQEFSDGSDLEAVKAIYHDIFQRIPQNTVDGSPRVSLERFKETDNINHTLTFWRELPDGALHVDQQDFRGLSLAGIRAQLSTWMQANPAVQNMQRLFLENKNLRYLPPEIENLANLQYLGINNNQLTMLPTEIENLANLQTLDLGNNHLTALPTEIENLANLQTLDLGNNHLTAPPKEIGNLANLEALYLFGNPLTALPNSFTNSLFLICLSPYRSRSLTDDSAYIADDSAYMTAATAYNFFQLSPEQQNAVYGCIYTLAIASGVNIEPWGHEYGKRYVFDSEELLVEAMNKALEEHPQEVS